MMELGKGALRQPADQITPKFRHSLAFLALAPIDWTVPFSNPEPLNNDQGASQSCVGQAWSYYHEQLKMGKRFSRRDLYAQISLGFNRGAYVYDGGSRIVRFGQATRDEVPDPEPETEAGMLDKTGISLNKEASDKELWGLTVSLDINQWAAAIKLCQGVVGGLEGTDAGWVNLAEPTPPAPNSAEWGHCLYFFGYHLHNGLKCVIAKSSWGTSGGTTVHHIKENYFNSGFMFNSYTLKSGELMKLVNDNGTIYIVGEKGKIGLADSGLYTALKTITAEETGSTAGIPQTKVIESISTFLIKDN